MDAAPLPPAPGSPSVLLVDDEPEILAILGTTFRRTLPHVQVLTAPNGEAGLKVLEARDVDVVLSDHCMPGMLGIDFLARARRIRSGFTGVLMTAHPEMDVAVRGVNERLLDRFLTKPFKAREVVETVRALLEDRQARAMQAQAFSRSFGIIRQRVGPVDA